MTKQITVAEAETVARACVTATDAAHACRTKAIDAFHAAWRPLVEASQATFGDWSASFFRALGRGPYHEEAERSGWCMVNPDRSIGIERWCMRCEIGKTATCGLVGCPGPAPKADPGPVVAKVSDAKREFAEEHGREPRGEEIAEAFRKYALRKLSERHGSAEPEQTIVVHWQKHLPDGVFMVDGDSTHYEDRASRVHFIRWRDRWCRVADEMLPTFLNLGHWLSEPGHKLEWEEFVPWSERDDVGGPLRTITGVDEDLNTREAERIPDEDGDIIEVSHGCGCVFVEMPDTVPCWGGPPDRARSLASALIRAADEVDPPKPPWVPLPGDWVTDEAGTLRARVMSVEVTYQTGASTSGTAILDVPGERKHDLRGLRPLPAVEPAKEWTMADRVRALMEAGRLTLGSGTPVLQREVQEQWVTREPSITRVNDPGYEIALALGVVKNREEWAKFQETSKALAKACSTDVDTACASMLKAAIAKQDESLQEITERALAEMDGRPDPRPPGVGEEG